MEYNDEILEKVKQAELEMLREFIRICKRLGLRWFAQGGTVLGAVRHQGFIPWDDDIDVGMPRRDYDIFMEKAQALLPPQYFVQNFHTDPQYIRAFGKIRNSNTTFLEKSVRHLEMNHGIYIDIFPLDGYSASAVSEFTYKWKKIVYDTKIEEVLRHEVPAEVARSSRLIAGISAPFNKGNVYDAVVKKDKLVRRYDYDDSPIIGNLLGKWFYKEIMPKDILGEGVFKPFEGVPLRIPAEYDQYLTRLYGDYMTPPPAEQRMPPHICEVIDPDTPYSFYTQFSERKGEEA